VRRLLAVALLLAAIAVPTALFGLSASPARADGDPASDFLLTYQVFYPYYSNTPKDSLTKLKETVADANKRGYRIRVAVITSPYDLGSVSALWEKPKAYAGFLAEELAFVYRGRLLIVSPKGYGYNEGTRRVGTTYVVNPSPKALALVRTVPIGKGTDGLLKTADRAVRVLAAKDGVKLPAVSGSTGSGSGSDTTVIALAAALGALLVVAFEVLRRRRRRQRASGEPEGAHLS
jgi:MYXO-CTERM domain-containing protein